MATRIGARPTVAHVDLDALAANAAAITGLLADGARRSGRTAPGVIGVVKANAYGHGAGPVALALEAAGVAMVACADVEEGVALREAGVRGPILVFGALSVSDLGGIFEANLTPTLSTPFAGRALQREATRRGVRLRCQLKIDTGMNRLGFRHDNLRNTMPELRGHDRLEITSIYTHFATADDPESPGLDEQRTRFETARGVVTSLGLPAVPAHAANSAALLRDERVWLDAVRPGLLLYGLVPPPLMSTLALRPVLSLTSRVVAVKGVRPGEAVGYGGRYPVETPRTLAVVPAGYADGLDTRLEGRGVALVRERRVPIVGSVCMDMLTVDVSGLDAEPGDEVVLLGRQGDERIDVREVAAAIGAIPYELLCRLGSRIQRIYT